MKAEVAIFMVTYNHEKFISRAIESAISQKTNFKYTLFIADDCSTDTTAEICERYSRSHPDKIVLRRRESNLGAEKNSRLLFKEIFDREIEYLAFLEGDDYWLVTDKLQRQFNFLNDNSDYQIVCSNVAIHNGENEFIRERLDFEAEYIDFDFDYILGNNHISTVTALIRCDWIRRFPIPDVTFRDKYFWLRALTVGNCRYLNEVMAVYTMHENGLYSGLSHFDKCTIRIRDYSTYVEVFPDYKKAFKRLILSAYCEAFLSAFKRLNIKGLFYLIRLIFKS